MTEDRIAKAMKEAKTTTFFGKPVLELTREELVYGLMMYAKKDFERYARRRGETQTMRARWWR